MRMRRILHSGSRPEKVPFLNPADAGTVTSVLCFGLFLYKWLIIIAVLLTWVSADPYNPIVNGSPG
ncbi:MAG: hypothetical protein Ct9H90mP9_2370 [Pseudomonadota bacterium]|nr:MAG: hypothetical protein Ct9H90mP9_2370 [Pseudomonadota bacterium]